MANNLIQIKRSLTNASPTLANGELAFTSNGDVLFIGANGATIAIAGKRVPGTLTANQAPVVNATSGIDKWIVANLVPTFITANASQGSAGQVLTSGGVNNVYWTSPTTGVAGANTQVQFNNSGTLAGDPDFTYDNSTNTLTLSATGLYVVGNSSVGTTQNTTAYFVASSASVNSYLTVAGLYFNGTQVVNTGGAITAFTANNASNLGGTAAANYVQNTDSRTLSGNLYFTGANSVFSSLIQVGAGVVNSITTSINTTALVVQSNATVNSYLTVSGLYFNGVLAVNSSFANLSSNNASYLGTVAAASYVQNTESRTLSGNLYFTGANSVFSSLIQVGAGVVNSITTSINTTALVVQSNATVNSYLTASGLYFNGVLSVNSTGGSLLSNNASNLGGTAAANYVNNTGNYTLAGNIAFNGTNTFFNTAAYVGANVSLSTSTLSIGNTTANMTANSTMLKFANSTAIANLEPGKLTIGTTVINTSNISVQDISVTGNLTISGTLTTIDTTTLAVKDNLILLADQQASTTTFTDAVDAGWYVPTGNTSVNNYSGMIRLAASSTNTNPYFKLFSTITSPNNTTINTSSTTGTLQAYLLPYGAGGAFVANATNVTLTANGTFPIGITANTLSLTTGLAATSGGTGKTTIGVGSLLIGNSTNTFTELVANSDGYVLQMNGAGVVAWNTLDGGTF